LLQTKNWEFLSPEHSEALGLDQTHLSLGDEECGEEFYDDVCVKLYESCGAFLYSEVKRRMEWLWIVLSILAIVVVSYVRRESMTNKDVQSALQKYEGASDRPASYETTSVSEYPIYGPKANPPEPATERIPGDGGTPYDSKLYPDIYGPDVELIPGTKPKSNKQSSDDTSDPTYEFNPDLQKAFPTSGPPQPFLNDFTPFQR
jgi:hypothetical protein